MTTATLSQIALEFGEPERFLPKAYIAGGLTLYISWSKSNKKKPIPVEFWPKNDDDIEFLIRAFLPEVEAAERVATSRSKLRQRRIDAYYRKMMPGVVKLVKVSSRSQPGKVYVITVYNTGAKKCSCPDYGFRRRQRGEYCKHIAEWMKKEKAETVVDAAEKPTPSTENIFKYKPWYLSYLPSMCVDEFFEEEWAAFVEKRANE